MSRLTRRNPDGGINVDDLPGAVCAAGFAGRGKLLVWRVGYRP